MKEVGFFCGVAIVVLAAMASTVGSPSHSRTRHIDAVERCVAAAAPESVEVSRDVIAECRDMAREAYPLNEH